MVQNFFKNQKTHPVAFLKSKATRSLECLKLQHYLDLNSINENESRRFSKNQNHDFILKSASDPSYSLNNSGHNFSMASIAETLIGKKIVAKTPYHIRKSIFLDYSKGFTISCTPENQNCRKSESPLSIIKNKPITNSPQVL